MFQTENINYNLTSRPRRGVLYVAVEDMRVFKENAQHLTY